MITGSAGLVLRHLTLTGGAGTRFRGGSFGGGLMVYTNGRVELVDVVVEGDVTAPHTLLRHIQGADLAYHLAGVYDIGVVEGRYYFTMELPGHVSGLLNASGQMVNEYRYSPFGKPKSFTRPASSNCIFSTRTPR